MITFHNSSFVSAQRVLVEADHPIRKRLQFKVRYGLVQHPRLGLVLIDTGYSADLDTLRGTQARLYRAMLGPELVASGQIGAVLARRGQSLADIRHVILTHLHPDHVCALAHLTHATIHLSTDALDLWKKPPKLLDITHGLLRNLLPSRNGLTLRPFETAPQKSLSPRLGTGFDLFGDGNVLAIALPGHMAGHCGLVIETDRGPLLYAADTAWTLRGLAADAKIGFAGRRITADLAAWHASRRRVAAFADAGYAVALAHDPDTNPFDAT